MFETIKEVYEEKIIKEHIKSLSRVNTTSLQADNVEDRYDINDLLIIESGVTKIRKNEQLKDDNVYIYNNMKEKIPNTKFWKMLWMTKTRSMKTLIDFCC